MVPPGACTIDTGTPAIETRLLRRGLGIGLSVNENVTVPGPVPDDGPTTATNVSIPTKVSQGQPGAVTTGIVVVPANRPTSTRAGTV